MVGFPGETDAQFENLRNFVTEMRFDRLGVFTYSAEEGTPAFALENPVPAKVMRARRDALMAAQQEISLENNRKWIGRDLTVLIESRRGPDAVGRSFRDAPEIDGTVTVQNCDAAPGTFVPARIAAADYYDLEASPI